MDHSERLGVYWDVWRATKDDRAGIESRQRRRARDVVAFARRHSRFYRRHYADVPENASSLRELPPVTKPELMANFDDVVTDPVVTKADVDAFVADESRVGDLFLDRYPVWTTSGTTGEPGVFLKDDREMAVLGALGAFRAGLSWLSLRDVPGIVRNGAREGIVAVTGGHYAAVASVERDRKESTVNADRVRAFSVQQPFEDLVAELDAFQPAMLVGYATVLHALAREQAAGRLDIDPALLVVSAETVSRAVKREIADAFDCTVRENYGATEFTGAAYECAAGNLHVNADWVVLEPVDANYDPVPPGVQSTTVLLTNLANHVQPIVRYDLGDSVTVHEEPCECGSPLPVVEVAGRSDDLLSFVDDAGDPVTVFPLAIGSVAEKAVGVHSVQLVQTAPATLRVRLTAEGNADEQAVYDRVAAALSSFLAERDVIGVTIEHATEPPRRDSASGKLRKVISEQ
ncbi:phenylacetate--CoA ligase family protein [Halobacteriaceae archaeon GCM10025711]